MKSLKDHVEENLAESIIDVAIGSNASTDRKITTFDRKKEPVDVATGSSK